MRISQVHCVCSDATFEGLAWSIRAAGAEPVRHDTPEGVAEALGAGHAAFLLPEATDGQQAAVEALLDRADRIRRASVVLGAARLALRPVRWMLAHPCVGHVLACPDGRPDPTEFRVLVARLRGGAVEGLPAFLGVGVATQEVLVADSRDKPDYVHAAAALAEAFGASPRWVEAVETVVDELVTNAIFNAPTDEDGMPRYAHLSRRQAVTLEPSERAVLRFGCNGALFGVSVRDPFGALGRASVLRHLVPCLGAHTGAQQFPPQGGAGLGLCRVLEAARTTAFDVSIGEFTEAVALVPIRQSIRSFKAAPRSLLYFLREVTW